MMNQSKRNRGGRMNPGGQHKRQMYSPDSRPPRQRGPVTDQKMNVDGVFKNQRITHVVITLVGSFVQVQVKNGIIYEGVLRTVSPKGDIMLDLAHMSEDNANSSSSSSAPSKERIIEKLIIKNGDVITLNAANVDLEYAVRDSFTDGGISKFNGDVKEKDLKELQPWDGDALVNDELLEDKAANGWDPNDMFKTNATQFNVKSSYDESLTQYTTKLEKLNTDEYKMREEKALRLAKEIEGTEQYKQNIALENGEGDTEEALFSSVVRPDDKNSQMGNAGGQGKYIPPNKRHGGPPHGGNPNMSNKHGRGNYSQQQQQYPPPVAQQPHQQHGYQQPNMVRNMHNHQQSIPHHTKHDSSNNVNGDDSSRASLPASTAGPTVKTSPVTEHSVPSVVDNKLEHNPNKNETKKHNKCLDEKIQELKEFGSNFKLGDNKEKDKEKVSVSETKDNVSEEKDTVSSDKVQVGENPGASSPPVQSLPSPMDQEQPHHQLPMDVDNKSESGETKGKDDITKKSTLNPNAKEFVYNPAKSMPQKQPTHQAQTPPRLQTQSPIIQNTQMNMAAPVYPSPGQPFVIPPGFNSNQSQHMAYNAMPKKAVVSVNKESYPLASTFTGQPLLAQNNPHNLPNQQIMYHLPHSAAQMMPQPTGYQTGQMMPMPAPQNRFVMPTSMQGMPPTSIHSGMDQNNPGGQHLYMQTPQQGPMPTHMPHGSQFNLAHLNLSNPNNQQTTSQMNQIPHSGAGHHHPAPSPVHSNPNQQQQQQQQQQSMNPGPHPPSSGTPQPQQGYSQPPTHQSHPPLQPSPRNPTSPQNMQQMPYHPHHITMQGSAGGQQLSMHPQSNMPTSVTHTPHMQPQYVMVPTPSGHHLHNNHQFQNHLTGPGSMPQLMSQPMGHHGQNHGQAPHHHNQMQHFPIQGLTAAALANPLHTRQDHFIVQHLRK